MRKSISIALAVAAVGFASQAWPAEVDMSKLTCEQVGAMPAAKTIGVAMWVNGYVHGKAGNPMVDGEKAHANAEKIAAFCKSNASSTLADAIEAVSKT